MEASGIVRRVDNLGRVVLPVEWRRTLQIGPGAHVEILATGRQLMLRRYCPGCVLCAAELPGGVLHVCDTCRRNLLAPATARAGSVAGTEPGRLLGAYAPAGAAPP